MSDSIQQLSLVASTLVSLLIYLFLDYPRNFAWTLLVKYVLLTLFLSATAGIACSSWLAFEPTAGSLSGMDAAALNFAKLGFVGISQLMTVASLTSTKSPTARDTPDGEAKFRLSGFIGVLTHALAPAHRLRSIWQRIDDLSSEAQRDRSFRWRNLTSEKIVEKYGDIAAEALMNDFYAAHLVGSARISESEGANYLLACRGDCLASGLNSFERTRLVLSRIWELSAGQTYFRGRNFRTFLGG